MLGDEIDDDNFYFRSKDVPNELFESHKLRDGFVQRFHPVWNLCSQKS